MKNILIGFCAFMTILGMTLFAEEAIPTSHKNIIILLGPPGSGKGTQAVKLSKELGIPHISTGDLFRENLSKGTELGKRAKSFIEVGKLVPDEVVLDMVYDRISKPDAAQGYLLDGFPRTIPQAEAFDKHIGNQSKIVVLNLVVADDVIVKRIAGRLTCKECGKIFSGSNNESQNCESCQGTLYQRPDDQPEVVKERLRVYHDQTKPLINYYEKKGLLINLNGEKTPNEVYADLIAAYKKRQ